MSKPALPALPALLSLALATSAFAQAKQPEIPADIPEKPTLTVPTGAYQIAWLTLDNSASKARYAVPSIRVFLALRDGKPAQAWILGNRLPSLDTIDPRNLNDVLVDNLTGNSTSASLLLRITSNREIVAVRTLKLDLTHNANQLTGTWTVLDADKPVASGPLAGTIQSEADLAKTDAIAKRQDWPSFYGTVSAHRGPDPLKPMIDDLAQAKPLWRSEVKMYTGWGNGADSRYRSVAGLGRLCGGSSSPIAADGIIYQYHYIPSGDGDLDDAAKEVIAKFADHAPAKDEMTRWYSKRADVVVNAIDAVTGKTLWQSTWPRKQGNFQTHKWRGLNHTPSIAHGTLVVSDYSWGLHAFNAKTGELKWTRGGNGPVVSNQGSIGPVISGDTVVWVTTQKTFGLDLATGKERWTAPGGTGARRMIIDNNERILLTGEKLTILDPANGAPLASADYPGGFENKGRKELGRGLYANLLTEGPYIISFETNRLPDVKDGVGTVFAFKVSDAGKKIEPAWRHDTALPMEDGHIGFTIASNKVFTAFQKGGAFAIDLATGKTFKNIPEMTAHSNPIFVSIGNRIFWQPECQHGDQKIQLIDADTFTPLGANWDPPHNDTTAYGEMPIANIIIDGRLILRAMDGLHAYDLRK